ncbi:hypothetical protein [uncultured Metabacillus sp.]|uniref:alpha-galactosidase n=1 Tax=uncultured Metabacillus sp. TaxID=2860135 RepID=UPI002612D919|nr:hypothetical protein [uncultured Metabacillus sp.]
MKHFKLVQVRDNDEWTLSLLTNKDVLAMHRNSHSNRLVYRENDKIVWAAKDERYTYAALFNAGNETRTVSVTLEQLGLSSSKNAIDIWNRTDEGRIEQVFEAAIPAHGVKLVKLS